MINAPRRPRLRAPALLLAGALLASLAWGLVSCATAPVVIPADLDAPALVQRAQEAADASSWDLAIRYYKRLMEAYGDPVNLVTGEYEIAFIEYKRGDKEAAKKGMESVLARYETAQPGSLPDLYRVLAQKILEKLGK